MVGRPSSERPLHRVCSLQCFCVFLWGRRKVISVVLGRGDVQMSLFFFSFFLCCLAFFSFPSQKTSCRKQEPRRQSGGLGGPRRGAAAWGAGSWAVGPSHAPLLHLLKAMRTRKLSFRDERRGREEATRCL